MTCSSGKRPYESRDAAIPTGLSGRSVIEAAQLTLEIQRPEGTPALIVRAMADRRVLRAVCDWTRTAEGWWVSANGWTVKPSWVGRHRDAWAAFAPDGVAEWGALDPVTAMVRAEGGS